MSVDVAELVRFYENPLGAVSRRFVGRTLAGCWPDLSGSRLLGLGYAVPYLEDLGDGCERSLAFMPGCQGVVQWPDGAPARSCLVDPLALPLPEGSIDRVLVVHALETAANPSELLHEVARVLVPGGRAILVCPNRRGLWARMDTTPFGHGQPYSRSQLRRLLRDCALEPARWAETLYVPPLRSRLLLRGAAIWERLGSDLGLPLAGLHVVEAAKNVARIVPVSRRGRARRTRPVFVPVPATRDLHPGRAAPRAGH